MKKVAFLTTFTEGSENGYSVTLVTERQIKMLLDHMYNPTVLVQENFKESEKFWNKNHLDLQPIVPFLHLTDGIAPDFEERVAKIELALEEGLRECDVCITEDIFLLNIYKEHSVAVRRYAKKRPDLLWLNWLHSVPTSIEGTEYPENSRYTSPPGYLVYPNSTDIAAVCQTYHLHQKEFKAKTLRHSINPLDVMNYHPLTKSLAVKADLLNGDIVMVYPSRPNSFKQLDKLIYLAAGIKNCDFEPRVLFVDWQSTGFQNELNQLQDLIKQLEMEDKVFFASQLDDKCSQGVPPEVVNQLLDLSNVYVHPSQIETYSLTTHEAFLRGKLVVLNHDCTAMRELYGQNALYMDFGSNTNSRIYHPNEQTFWNDESKRLVAEWKSNRALQGQRAARKEWSTQVQWRNFEPLLYLQSIGE